MAKSTGPRLTIIYQSSYSICQASYTVSFLYESYSEIQNKEGDLGGGSVSLLVHLHTCNNTYFRPGLLDLLVYRLFFSLTAMGFPFNFHGLLHQGHCPFDRSSPPPWTIWCFSSPPHASRLVFMVVLMSFTCANSLDEAWPRVVSSS